MPSTQRKTDVQVELDQAIALAAAAAVVKKEARRDLLPALAQHRVFLSIEAAIGSQRKPRPVIVAEGTLSVGADTQRNSTRAPDVEHLVAILLAKLPTQAAVHLCRSLPDQFAAEGVLPFVAEEHLAAAKSLLTRLRARTTETVRGSVSYAYALE